MLRGSETAPFLLFFCWYIGAVGFLQFSHTKCAMYEVERFIKESDGTKERKKWPVYTAEEATEKGIVFSPVRQDMKAGEYVLSDDGFVAEIVRVNGPYKNSKVGTKHEYILPYCRRFSKGTSKDLNFLDFWDVGVFCWHAPKRTSSYEVRRPNFKKAMKRFAFLYITQKGIISEEQIVEVGKVYRPDDPLPGASFKRMLKTTEAKSMLNSELKGLMEEHGVSPGIVIKQHQRIIDLAIRDGQFSVAEKANGRFMDMLDLMPNKKTVTQSVQGTIGWGHLLDEEEPQKVLTTHETDEITS